MSPCKLLKQGHQTFCQRDLNYYIIGRGPDILCNVMVSGYVTFYQISKYFSLLTKCLPPDQMVSRVGFGLWEVVWRAPAGASKLFCRRATLATS